MNRIVSTLLIAGLVLVTVPQIAFADTAEEVEALSAKGAEAYKRKKYDRAIKHFQAAYDLEPVPNLLFNIAKCYEKMKDWDGAIDYYEKFVVAPDVESEYRESAMAKIDSLKEVKQLEEDQKKEEEKKLTKDEKKDEKEDEEPDTIKAKPRPKPDRTLAYIVAGSGIALIGGGVVFGLLASQKEADFKAGETSDERRSAQESGKTMALVADTLFIGGAIATTIGIILYATAKPKEQDPQLSGWISKDGAGIGVGFGF